MPRDEARAKLDLLVEQIEREAFQRGWDAAVNHIMSAAANAPKGTISPATGVSPRSSEPQRAGYGIVPALVREVLAEAGDRGITPAEVVARGLERGERIAASSVRQRLRKLKTAQEVRNARGRWFRVRPADHTGEQESGDADTSPAGRLALDDGGYHAAA